MDERYYYVKIQNFIERARRFRPEFDSFFSLCQKYYWKYLIRNNMAWAEGIIKNYFYKEDYISKCNKNEKTREDLELEEKLYLEFLWEIGDKYYPGKNIIDVIYSDTEINVINKCFLETPCNYITNISTILKQGESNNQDYILVRHDYQNIHKAMDLVKKALHTPAPSIAESVEKVIAPVQLETILSALQADRVEIALFTIAPIRRALYDGAYRTYIYDNKDNRAVYFNIKCEYNFVQLDKRIKDIENLLGLYEDTMTELNNYRNKLKPL